MSVTALPGFPRIGAHRELKFALEKYWKGKISQKELIATGVQLRGEHWRMQKERGIEVIPSNDFSFYDQVLDMTCMVGAIPERFEILRSHLNDLDLYFAMARGYQKGTEQIPAMEMTKWFDTNYHYIVPELSSDQHFTLRSTKPVDEFIEAREAGLITRPVLLGPVSYLLLSKSSAPATKTISLLTNLLPVYAEILEKLISAGAEWVQMDEPCLVTDMNSDVQGAYQTAYQYFKNYQIKIMLTTYFDGLTDVLDMAVKLPVAGLHIDLVKSPEQLERVLSATAPDKVLSLGLIDGRNVWKADLNSVLQIAQKAAARWDTTKLQISTNCSLLFCPYDLTQEENLNPELKTWLSFAIQKLDELTAINMAVNGKIDQVQEYFANNTKACEDRRTSKAIVDQNVQKRVKSIQSSDYNRQSDYCLRRKKQSQVVPLPVLPTTTIGSFPQTIEVRKQRAAFNSGMILENQYKEFVKREISNAIQIQEELNLDVLVHGEFERTDMVEFFAEKLNGFAFTENGWVQSYGSRCVRPPIIYGDVSRPKPMTVEWTTFAQSLTKKPVKGMLTGPITILFWSFVRNDQPLDVTGTQIALCLRDEVNDLESAGIKIIQIDEPALREGLPLHKSAQNQYLQWAVNCFRLACGGADDRTQIHTHMCYGEFADIMKAIVQMDADVISIEASRSGMELLKHFSDFSYPNEIGPGIYDIHSPRIPTVEEYINLITKALKVLPAEKLWINPDCGLKTRNWDEVIPALKNMIEATTQTRKKLFQ